MPLPLIPLGIGLGASLLSGLLGRKKPQTTTTTGQSTTTPSFAPEVSPLLAPLVNAGLARLRNRGGLPAGYEAQGVQGINQTFDVIQQGLKNKLVGSGQIVAGAPNPAQALAVGNLEGQRGANIGQFIGNLPNVARDMENQDLAQVLAILGLGRGSSTTSTGTTTGQGESVGQGIGNGLTDFGSILGFLAANGMFGKKPQPGSSFLGGGVGVGGGASGSY